ETTLAMSQRFLHNGGKMEEYGYAQHQELARRALPKAQGARKTSAPLDRAGSHAVARGNARRAGPRVHPGTARARQGALAGRRRSGARRPRATRVGLASA